MRQSIDLTDDDWQSLAQLAARTKSNSTRGAKIGAPSWRTLLARLARDEDAQRLLINHYAATNAAPPRHELPRATIIRPPNPILTTLAWVTIQGKRVRVFQPERNDVFGTVVKALNYQWLEPYWTRSFATEVLAHRAAEICHRLVAAGFCVVPPNAAIAQSVIGGDFERETTRVVNALADGEYRGWFEIRWSRGEDYYEHAKKITASRYHKPHVIVPPEHYDEVLDFAGRYNFTVTQAALIRANEARLMLQSALLLDIEPEGDTVVDDSIPRLKVTQSEIDDEFADDPL